MTIQTFISQLAEHCGVTPEDLVVNVEEDEQYVNVTIELPEEDSGRFIGFHGETLESIQRIVRLVFQEAYGEKKVIVNINHYRQDRAERLKEITQYVVADVLATGDSYTFQSFLPAHERFVIHTTLSELPEADQLESVSEGTGKNRRLTIRKVA
jgi:predicted RNA-binding protein Jag